MPNKKAFIFITTIVILYLNSSMQSNPIKEVFIGKPTAVKLEALGAELDPHFFSQNLTRNDGSKASDWDIVRKRVKAMQLQKLRVMVQPQWYEPINDNEDPNKTDFSKFTFESAEMQSLYKVLDLAEELKMEVNLVLWGCPVYVSLLDPAYKDVITTFMADPSKKDVWITGPTDYEEWAESFSALVKHLQQVKKYKYIKEITPMNEPDGGPLLNEVEYIKMAKILDSRFKKDQLREHIKFNLSDNTDTRTFYLEACVNNLANEADVFNSHTYIFGYTTSNKTIFDWEQNNVRLAGIAGKKHLVGEFGSNQTVGSSRQKDIDLFERGVLMTRQVLNFLNAGAAGVSYWSLIDQYYGKDADYQQMQQLGMWKYIKEAYKTDTTYHKIKSDYEVRPQYYAYSLLTRFIRPGSTIHPIELGEDLAIGSAFLNKDNKWIYVFANNGSKNLDLKINNPKLNGNFKIFKYEKDSLPKDDNMIASNEKQRTIAGKLNISLKANSMILCQQL